MRSKKKVKTHSMRLANKNKKMNTLIIGAGPAGLAVAGRMRKANLPFTIIEQNEQVGSAWHSHYDRLHLHTVKELSHLPHLPFPKDYPRYVPRKKLIAYFEEYSKHFDIKPEFGVEVTWIKKEPNEQKWEVQTKGGKKYSAANVIVATGINRTPKIPKWTGQETFKGDIQHSIHYKNPEPYKGKKVLVIGMGNTGAEIAFDLSNYDIETYISVRNPLNIVPRDLNGRSVQLTAKKLAKLPFGLGDWIGGKVRRIHFGDLRKYGLEPSKLSPLKQVTETNKTAVIDIGTVQAIKEGKIKVVKDITHFTPEGVVFKNGTTQEIDKVILATGYLPNITSFIERGKEVLDKFSCPHPPIPKGYHKGLYFVGYDSYKLGGILGTIFTDSELVVKDLLGSSCIRN